MCGNVCCVYGCECTCGDQKQTRACRSRSRAINTRLAGAMTSVALPSLPADTRHGTSHITSSYTTQNEANPAVHASVCRGLRAKRAATLLLRSCARHCVIHSLPETRVTHLHRHACIVHTQTRMAHTSTRILGRAARICLTTTPAAACLRPCCLPGQPIAPPCATRCRRRGRRHRSRRQRGPWRARV